MTFKFEEEEVFRFTIHRPAHATDVGTLAAIFAKNEETFQDQISQAFIAEDATAELAKLDDSQQNYDHLVFDENSIALIGNYREIHSAILASQWRPEDELDSCVQLVEATFGKTIPEVLALQEFILDKSKMQNSAFFGVVYQPYGVRSIVQESLQFLRINHLIEVLKPPVPMAVSEKFGATENFCKSVMLQLPIVAPIPSRDLAQPAISASVTISTDAAGEILDETAETRDNIQVLITLRRKLENLGFDDFYEPENANDPWEQVFGSVKESVLSQDEKEVLEVYGLDFRQTPVGSLIAQITDIIDQNSPADIRSFSKAGTTSTKSRGIGKIRSVGIADLLVVNQHIKRYDLGEIGHIENVLPGETRAREHTRRESTEVEISSETESFIEEERDSQTTDRMEIRREVREIVENEASLKSGASLSASYGPSVSFKTYIDGATSSSEQEEKNLASTYSRETVQRAASKISERIQSKRRTTTINEITETNRHEFTHEADEIRPIAGIYQWVDKVYQSQVASYGKRVIYDIMVPEPAASFIHALRQGADDTPINLVKPEPFDVEPNQLNRYNYQKYVIRYGVSSVTHHPEPFTQVVKSYADTMDAANQSKSFASELAIPDDYQAMFGRVSTVMAIWQASPTPTIDVTFGGSSWRRQNGDPWTSPRLNLDNRAGSVATLATAVNTPTFAVGYDAYCKLSTEGTSKWQNKVHSEIMTSYLEALNKYERRLEDYTSSNLATLLGRSPDENRAIERVEIKKTVTRIFLGDQFDFGSITDVDAGFPDIDESELSKDARIIRFFEQAFEWREMQYRFYPYYWGRKEKWLEKILNRDSDPLFRDFLRSGAARVVLSVRPGFESAVAHYFLTGQVWSGGELPDITDPEYLPILQEIKESQGQSESVPYGDEWEFNLPTKLVMLRSRSGLPKWKRDQTGKWVEDEAN